MQETAVGRAFPVSPGVLRILRMVFPVSPREPDPGGILRILRMRLRVVPSGKAGTHEGAGS